MRKEEPPPPPRPRPREPPPSLPRSSPSSPKARRRPAPTAAFPASLVRPAADRDSQARLGPECPRIHSDPRPPALAPLAPLAPPRSPRVRARACAPASRSAGRVLAPARPRRDARGRPEPRGRAARLPLLSGAVPSRPIRAPEVRETGNY